MVKTNEKNGVFEMITPYNKDFISRIKTIGSAKWSPSKKCWTVAEEDAKQAKKILMEVYGEDGDTVPEEVTIRIRFTDDVEKTHEPVTYAGKVLARAWDRDSGARVGDDVVLESGKIDSGGSRNHWKTVVAEGTVMTVKHVNKLMLEKELENDDSYGIELIEKVVKETINKEALIEEKEKLLDRLAEIEKLLGGE